MKYRPNRVPLGERIWNKALASLLLIYGGYGIYINDLYLPGKHGRGVHLYNESALIMYGAFICGALVMLSIVVDHYDERDNEHRYHLFAKISKYLGWGLFGGALIYDFLK